MAAGADTCSLQQVHPTIVRVNYGEAAALLLQAAEKFPPTQPRKPQTLYHLILPRWSTAWTA